MLKLLTRLTVLTATIATLAACSSDSSNDTSASNDMNSGVIDDSVADPSSSDNAVSTGESDNPNTTVSTEGDASNPDESTITVCGEVNNSFSYTIHNSGPQDHGYSITSPVGGYGWDGTSFCDMDNSFGVTGIAALIPQSNTTPVIDGATEFFDPQWSTSSSTTSIIDSVFDNNITRHLLESNVPGYQDGSRSGEWIALHDNEYLYLRFLTWNERSESGNNQIFRDSDDPHDDDSIELFIDGDNSKGSSYDSVDDFHVTIAFRDTEVFYGPNSKTGLELEHDSGFRLGGPEIRSYWYEIKIKLSSAGIVVGRPFGFDIQLNDDDNGGDRDARFAWFEATGSVRADREPSVFGTVLLTGCESATFCGTNQLLNPSL